MLIQYILLAIIGLLVAGYILYTLYQILWGKEDKDGCSSGSCNACSAKNKK